MNKKDLEFLTSLDKKLRHVHKVSYTFNISGGGGKDRVSSYTDKKMAIEEVEKVLRISQNKKLVIFPLKTNYSFGYEVAQIKKKQGKTLIKFDKNQLPEEYTFDKMSKTFMKRRNLKKAKLIAKQIINDESHYWY
jgi:hypothetical protein